MHLLKGSELFADDEAGFRRRIYDTGSGPLRSYAYAAYDTAKGGVNALTRYIAVEYGVAGIRANAIAPGAIRTEMLAQAIREADDPGQMERDMAVLHPLERLGEPSEIAAVAAFLLSDESSFVSGQTIGVDGGANARAFRFPSAPDLPRRGDQQ